MDDNLALPRGERDRAPEPPIDPGAAPPLPPFDEPEGIPPLGEAVEGPLPVAGTVAGTALPGSSTDLAPGAPAAARPKGTLVERASLAVFWNAAFLPLKLLAKLVASIIVVRSLHGDGFEVLTQVGALLTMLGTLTDLGVERALPRFIPEFEKVDGRAGLGRLLRRVALVKLAILLPFVVLLLLVPDVFLNALSFQPQNARLVPAARGLDGGPLLLGMVAIMLVLGAASDVSIQVLYAYFRQRTTNALDILNTFIPVLQAILVVPALGLGVYGALLALLIGTAVSVALSVFLMFRALSQERLSLRAAPRPRRAAAPGSAPPPTRRSLWVRFGAYSIMMYLMNLSTTLYDQSFVVLLVGIIVANSTEQRIQVVLIGLGFKFVRQLLQALVVPLTGVQTPLFSRLYAENRIEGLRTAYAGLTRFLILVLFPAGVGLILVAQPLLVLLYVQPGADAVLPANLLPEAVATCAILTVGLFGDSMVSVALNVLMVYEDYRAVLIARAVTLVSVPLLLLLEPRLGVVGIALAVAASALGSRLVALALGLRRLGLRFPTAFLGRVVLATLPFALLIGPACFLLPTGPLKPLSGEWIGQAAITGLLVLIAAALFWLTFRRLGGLEAEDRDRFAGLRIPGMRLVLRYL